MQALESVLKNTALISIHQKLGAKIVPFAGYNMPVQYEGINIEHECVRNAVGVFDVSHMGEFIIKGPEALNLVQFITSNDASLLKPGKIQYSCLPNEDNGIIDDLLVYKMSANEFMLVVNASNITKDWNWINKNNSYKTEVINISGETSLLAIQGPNAISTLQKLTTINLKEIPYYTFVNGKFAGHDNIILSATGYTGSGGFELYFPNNIAENIWNKIFEAGKEFGIKPIGLGARDTLRLEMGYCLYGNDIDETTSPLEAGLGWITKFSKDFINSSRLRLQKTLGVTHQLIGFEMMERGVPRHHYEITDGKGNKIGYVTSGTQSPILQKGIGMGYVEKKYTEIGSEIHIKIREKELKAKVVKMPFIKSGVK